MFKMKKNDPVASSLKKYAEGKGMPLKNILLSDEHLSDVCDIFYPNLPKLVRMTMNKDKFVVFYKQHRESFAEQIGNI